MSGRSRSFSLSSAVFSLSFSHSVSFVSSFLPFRSDNFVFPVFVSYLGSSIFNAIIGMSFGVRSEENDSVFDLAEKLYKER